MGYYTADRIIEKQKTRGNCKILMFEASKPKTEKSSLDIIYLYSFKTGKTTLRW